jgi:thioredoxin-dependent peroxiredoxin
VGVSADDQETSDRFGASLDLPYPMVGDPAGRILKAYEVRWPLIGVAHRVTYLVGADRRVQQVIRGERDADHHVAEACAFVARPRR